MKHYYTYRIDHIPTGNFYHGARASKTDPKLDLGIKYFSSSKIVKSLLASGSISDFKFTVISEYCSWEEAYLAEQALIFKNWSSTHRLNKTCYFGKKNFAVISDDTKAKISSKSKEMWLIHRDKIVNSQKDSWNDSRREKYSNLTKSRWTDEAKASHSIKLTGHVGSTKLKGVPKPEGFGKLISSKLSNKPKSEEHKRKLSEARQRQIKIKCDHCGKEVVACMHSRFHGNNCKFNPSLKLGKH
jgi:hypothetical protein